MSIIEKALDKLDVNKSLPKLELNDESSPFTDPAPTTEKANNARGSRRGTRASPIPGTGSDASPPEAHLPSSRVSKPKQKAVSPNKPGAKSEEIVLDLRRLRDLGLLTPQDAHSRLAEQNRHIKRPLLMNAMGKGAHPLRFPNTILVTSSLPNEGKTFVSVNLAMSIAMEMDRTVLLVDADVVKSDVCNVLGIKKLEGITDVLASDHMSIADVMLKTNIPKLTVVPAGRGYPNVTGLFSSEQMTSIVQEFASRYEDRIVIFDSAPLLATTVTAILSGLVGQVAMVVEAERTARSSVEDALEMLSDANAQTVSLILNKTRERGAADYYGYGYGA